MAPLITSVSARDIRFPTSRGGHGSDAMNPGPDYSAAYAVVETDDGRAGHGFTFTIGRGNELCVAAIDSLAPRLVGGDLATITSDMGGFWHHLTGDSQLRWLGPEKGVIHLATAALVNAVWDLWARTADKPLWKLLSDLAPDELVACVPFGYIEDALSPAAARDLLEQRRATQPEREREMRADGFPAYTTSTGWLGYPEDEVRRLSRAAVQDGWRDLKMKVGGPADDDVRRAQVIRDEIGPDRRLMLDANQVWGVPEAIRSMERLAAFDPYWIEEPTSPDGVLGHAAIARAVEPIRVATGEHCCNRVVFKQLMQARAMDVCQVDACRLGGVNEVLAVLLLAARRMVEYVDHLHEHFEDPVHIRDGRYVAPEQPGYSAAMRPESLDEYEFPAGAAWREAE